MEIVPVNLILYISAILYIFILVINTIIILKINKKIGKTLTKEPEKFIELADKYNRLPIAKRHKNAILVHKVQSLVITKNWEEIKSTIDLINMKMIKRKSLVNEYVLCALYTFTNNKVEIAKYMMSKIKNIDCPEFRLADAISNYNDGDIKRCKFILDNILNGQLDPKFLGYYNYYMGLISEGEIARNYFQLAIELGGVTLKQKANEMLSKLLDEGEKNE